MSSAWRDAVRAAAALALASLASLAVSGGLESSELLARGILYWGLASLATAFIVDRVLGDPRLVRIVLLIVLSGLVVEDAFTTSYGVASGLIERGLVASRFSHSIPVFLQYFVIIEFSSIYTIYLVLAKMICRTNNGRRWVRNALILFASGLGPAVASYTNLTLIMGQH